MNNGFSEQLFSAIDQIVDSKLAKTTYGNELIAGKVVQKISDQLYQIAYNGLYIEAYAEENKKYELNDHVHVCIPNGDFSSGDKIILGKFIYPNKNEVQTNLGWQSKMTKGMTLTLDKVLNLPIAKQTETITTTIIPISTNTNDLSKYNCLNISASFEAIGLEEARTGEYGLQFLFCHNDIIVNTSEYKMSCLDDIFTTNPYSIIPNLNITTLFDINEIPMNLVNSIQVMLYADNKFEYTGSINLINLTLTLGENIEAFIDKPITIYSNNIIYNNAEHNDISINTILVHPTTLDCITELPKDNTIYWYELTPGYSGDIYAGPNWRRISEGTKLDNYIPNINTLSTSIKALWCERINDDLFKTIGESNILVFNNTLNNYINHAKDTVIKIIGKTYLPVYKDDDTLAYTISPNYVYEISFLQNIKIDTITWDVSTNGLIAGFIDPNTNGIVNRLAYKSGEFPTSVTISPLNYFDGERAKSNANIITCTINNIYTAEIFVEFAQQTTQGTNYIFSIEPTGSDFLVNSLGETQSFRAVLTKIDGTPVDLEPNRLSWSWYQQDTFTTYDNEIIELAIPMQQNYIDIIPDVLSNRTTISLNKIFNNQFNPPIIEEVYDGTEIIGHRVTVPEEKGNTHILQAKYTIDAIFQAESQKDLVRTIELVAHWPIKVISPELIQDNLEINGQFELNWNNEGELINFNSDFSANGAYSINQAPQAIWSIISEQPSNYYTIAYRDAYVLELPESSAYKSEKLSIIAVSPDGELLYSQPLTLSLNNFSIDMTNKWAGGVVSVDEEAATIMAAAMGAGHKNIDNSFTGVLMGDIQLNQQSAIDSGLFGFNNGQMVFKLNKDAEFFVGTDQYNYISFKDNFFDLKTQTLKLNALQDHFVIDSTGTTQVYFQYTDTQPKDIHNAVIAANNNFIVTANGYLYANNAEISGKIITNEGRLGGFEITPTSILGKFSFDSVRDDMFLSHVPTARRICGQEIDNCVFALGQNDNLYGQLFGVDSNGHLYCDEANIYSLYTNIITYDSERSFTIQQHKSDGNHARLTIDANGNIIMPLGFRMGQDENIWVGLNSDNKLLLGYQHYGDTNIYGNTTSFLYYNNNTPSLVMRLSSSEITLKSDKLTFNGYEIYLDNNNIVKWREI